MAIHRFTNILNKQYPTMKVFTQRDLLKYDYFPKQLPDSVLSLAQDSGDPHRYFFDIIPAGTPRKAVDSKLMQYCTFFDGGDWKAMRQDNPAILLIASDVRAERQLQHTARARLARQDDSDLQIFTSTVQALLNMDSEGTIWTNVEDPDGVFELTELFS